MLFINDEQFSKDSLPISVTDEEIVIFVSIFQSPKTDEEIVIFVVHFSNKFNENFDLGTQIITEISSGTSVLHD